MFPIIFYPVYFFNLFVLIYFFTLNFFYLFLLCLAAVHLFYYKRMSQLRTCTEKICYRAPSISVLVPCHNEELTIKENIHALLGLNYPEFEIIAINDGSTDNTLKVLQDEFKLLPYRRSVEQKISTKPVKGIYRSLLNNKLTVIDKENGGKADSLNAGINYSRSRLFTAIDADSLVEKNALIKLVHAYLERTAKIVAIGGTVRIANDCLIKNGEVVEARVPKKILPAIQVMEYIRAFLCGRAGWNRMNNLLIISGAFGLFDRNFVLQVGGYRTDTVGEDMELVVRLHRTMREGKKPYRITFIPDPVCWTAAPDNTRVLSRQRNRWQRGLIETFLHHKKMLFNPKYGLVGFVAMPYFLFYEILGPIVETSGYITVFISYFLGWLNIKFVILFLFLAVLLGVFLSLFSLLLEEFTLKRYENSRDVLKLLFMAILENFGYRQLHSFWRLKAIFDLIRKKSPGELWKGNLLLLKKGAGKYFINFP